MADLVWTERKWNEELESGNIEDISSQLSASFLMYGQRMRALIVWRSKVYYANAWDNGVDPLYVELTEKKDAA